VCYWYRGGGPILRTFWDLRCPSQGL
jgi:hypothetical protein